MLEYLSRCGPTRRGLHIPCRKPCTFLIDNASSGSHSGTTDLPSGELTSFRMSFAAATFVGMAAHDPRLFSIAPLGATICCSTQGALTLAGFDTRQGADRKVSCFMCRLAATFASSSMRLARARSSFTSALALRCSALVLLVSAARLAFICASSRSCIAS